MEKYCASSDVKAPKAERLPLPAPNLPPVAFPEVLTPPAAMNSHTGASAHNIPKSKEGAKHLYALRTTYGREKKAYDYLVTYGIEFYLPLLKSVKQVDGKRTTDGKSRIPNIFFARVSEDELKPFVYYNVNLPFLRFYYSLSSVGHQTVSVPLIVPDSQISNLKIVCATDGDGVVAILEAIERFKECLLVRITEGKFNGVNGIAARHQSQLRLGIIIEAPLSISTDYVPSAFYMKLNKRLVIWQNNIP